MKRAFIIIMLICAAMGLYAQTADELMRYYQDSDSQAGKLDMLRQYAAEQNPGAEEFYARALNVLIAEYPNVRGNQEVAAADAIAQLLAEQLGEARHAPAAVDLGRLVEAFTNPLARGAALIALGKMHEASANYYLVQTARILSNLNNMPPSQDREGAERFAYRAVIALENYQNIDEGYLPVFFAALGTSWYSDQVRLQAKTSLEKISGDPSGPLTGVIQSASYTVDVKHAALEAIDAQAAGTEPKSQAAVAAYVEGWRLISPEPRTRIQLANMRKLALRMLYQYGTEDQAVLAPLERSYKEGLDTQERYAAINTLSALAARGNLEERTIGLLGGFLIALNGKCSDGSLTPADEAMVRVIIPALGNTRKQGAVRPLNTVQSVPWTNTVKRLARTAIGTING